MPPTRPSTPEARRPPRALRRESCNRARPAESRPPADLGAPVEPRPPQALPQQPRRASGRAGDGAGAARHGLGAGDPTRSVTTRRSSGARRGRGEAPAPSRIRSVFRRSSPRERPRLRRHSSRRPCPPSSRLRAASSRRRSARSRAPPLGSCPGARRRARAGPPVAAATRSRLGPRRFVGTADRRRQASAGARRRPARRAAPRPLGREARPPREPAAAEPGRSAVHACRAAVLGRPAGPAARAVRSSAVSGDRHARPLPPSRVVVAASAQRADVAAARPTFVRPECRSARDLRHDCPTSSGATCCASASGWATCWETCRGRRGDVMPERTAPEVAGQRISSSRSRMRSSASSPSARASMPSTRPIPTPRAARTCSSTSFGAACVTRTSRSSAASPDQRSCSVVPEAQGALQPRRDHDQAPRPRPRRGSDVGVQRAWAVKYSGPTSTDEPAWRSSRSRSPMRASSGGQSSWRPPPGSSAPPSRSRVRGAPIDCLFNPTEYSISKTNVWKVEPVTGSALPPPQFTGGLPRELTLELLFDTSDSDSKDVREITDKLLKATEVGESGGGRPPTITFGWGQTVSFKAVARQLTIRYTLFRPDGSPIRALAHMSLMQAEKAQDASSRSGRHPGRRQSDHAGASTRSAHTSSATATAWPRSRSPPTATRRSGGRSPRRTTSTTRCGSGAAAPSRSRGWRHEPRVDLGVMLAARRRQVRRHAREAAA